jgi:hypothetical protein
MHFLLIKYLIKKACFQSAIKILVSNGYALYASEDYSTEWSAWAFNLKMINDCSGSLNLKLIVCINLTLNLISQNNLCDPKLTYFRQN